MKGFKTIFLKEFKRVFTDTRMLFAMFIPGILIFVIYSCMGSIMKGTILKSSIKDSTFNIAYTDNYSSDNTKEAKLIKSFIDSTKADVESHNSVNKTKISYKELSQEDKESTIESYKSKVLEHEYDVLIVFTDLFDDKVASGSEAASNRVITYYDGSIEKSNFAYQILTNLVPITYNNYSLNVDESHQPIQPNLSNKDFTMNKLTSFILPMLTISLLYSTVITIVPETIAGEKERQTLAALLLTPTKRSEILLGKIVNLSIATIASGIVSFAGLLTSLPKLMGVNTAMSLSFSFGDIILLLFLILTTLILLLSFGTLISCFAKTTKEANSYLGPLTVLFMALALVPLFMNSSATWLSFVPIVNLSSCMVNLISYGSMNVFTVVLTLASNILFASLMIFVTTRLFNKEKFIIR